jgi:putative addiction module component (TIGR02574 family)
MDPQFQGIFDLSFAERLQLVEDLWDSLAATPEQLPMPDWQKEELDRREEEHLKSPASAIPWEQALEELRRRER